MDSCHKLGYLELCSGGKVRLVSKRIRKIKLHIVKHEIKETKMIFLASINLSLDDEMVQLP